MSVWHQEIAPEQHCSSDFNGVTLFIYCLCMKEHFESEEEAKG
jgi:hypothetical protein